MVMVLKERLSMLLKDLKARHESGERIAHKSIKKQIKAQLARECAQRGCHVSLAFKNRRKTLCDAHRGTPLAKALSSNSKKRPVKRVTKVEQRRVNREKKKRYYEKHGITFNKTVRKRNAGASKSGVDYNGQILLYENYKEPLKAIEKNKGYGYYGTIATTNDQMYIQCHICGNLYSNLAMHLRIHKIKTVKYKEMFELALGTALISEPVRQERQKNTVHPFNGKLPDHLAAYNQKVQQGLIKHNGNNKKDGTKRNTWSLERRNKEGLCPDQVLEKIRELADELRVVPGLDDFKRKYNGRYIGPITYLHGGWTNAVKKACGMSREELRSPDNEKLLQELRDFHDKYERIPMTSDFNRGLLRNRGIFIARFGSLNNARVQAGLNAVIPMPFGQIVELTPEQYAEYTAGHNPLGFKQPHQRSTKRRGKVGFKERRVHTNEWN